MELKQFTIEELDKATQEYNQDEDSRFLDLISIDNKNYYGLGSVLNTISSLDCITEIEGGVWFIYFSDKLKRSVLLEYEEHLYRNSEDVIVEYINNLIEQAYNIENSITN